MSPSTYTISTIVTDIADIPVMELMLVLSLAACLLLLAVIQLKKDKFDLRYLIIDDTSKKPSIHKLGQALALLVSTWGFVYLIEHDKFSEGYLTIYMGVWAGSTAMNKWLDSKAQPTSSSTSTITSQTTGDQNGH